MLMNSGGRREGQVSLAGTNALTLSNSVYTCKISLFVCVMGGNVCVFECFIEYSCGLVKRLQEFHILSLSLSLSLSLMVSSVIRLHILHC